MKHLYILNPAAGKQDRTAELRQEIETLAQAQGLNYEISVTQYAGHDTEIVRSAAQTGEELRVYACGGDGTLNGVVNGAIGYPNVAVTHVPRGSGNDFVKLFSEPAAFGDFSRLLDAEEAVFDVVRVNDSYSIGICSIGFDARIGTDVSRYKRLPLVSGPGAYALSVIFNLIRGMHEHYQIRLGDRILDGRYTMVSLCNGRWYGGGYLPVPEADPSDGMLDVLLVKKVSRLTVPRLIGKYKAGHYAEMPEHIEHVRCTSLSIRADEEVPVNLDGELLRAQEVNFTLEPKAIRFFYPRGLSWISSKLPVTV